MEKEFGLRDLSVSVCVCVDDLKVGLKLGLISLCLCGVCLYNSHMM